MTMFPRAPQLLVVMYSWVDKRPAFVRSEALGVKLCPCYSSLPDGFVVVVDDDLSVPLISSFFKMAMTTANMYQMLTVCVL